MFDEGYNISLRDITYKKILKKGLVCISPIIKGDSIIYRHKTTSTLLCTLNIIADRNFDDAIFLDSLSNILDVQ
ncbi:MAG: hypothetical protein ACLRPW_06785 [Intestinibacter sp.]